MKLLKKRKLQIGIFMVFSFFAQSVTPFVAMSQNKKRKAADDTFVDFNVNAMIKQIVEDAALSGVGDRLSDTLKRCYKTLYAGQQALHITDAWRVMPDILRYVIEAETESCCPTRYILCDFATLLDAVVTLKIRMDTTQSYRSDDALMRVLALAFDKLSDDPVMCAKLMQIMSQCEQPTKKYLTMRAPALDFVSTLTECCCPISLTQADVVAGLIDLTSPGNYKLCEDIIADVRISTTGISLDLNDRILTGIVTIFGDDVIVKNGFIQPPAPETPGIPAALAIEDSVVNIYLQNLTITCADSTATFNNNGLDGRHGIINNGRKTFIIECSVQTGAGANGGDSFFSGGIVPAGNGGTGGNGIICTQTKAHIIRTLVITGAGGSGGVTNAGSLMGGNAGASGTGILLLGDLSSVAQCKVLTGNGGAGGQNCCGNGGNGGNSGDGIYNSSQSTQIINTTSRTGNAGNGGLASGGANTGGAGGSSGHAIHTTGTQIVNDLVSTGNAGNGGSGGIGGSGGSAGYGLFVDDACDTETRELVVEHTGNGGDGGNSSNPGSNGGSGGNGADAVHITQGSKHTEVRNGTFSNTGKAGLGGTPGAGGVAGVDGDPGRAVTDLNNDACSLDPDCDTNEAPSAIFNNFAYGIADTTIRYLINGKNKESGKASDKSCNRLDNVYVDCDVDVVFDICAAIEDVESTLTACCERLHNDILDSETAILEAIAECCGTTTNCCDSLLACCEDTRDTLTECCASLHQDILNSETTILAALADCCGTTTCAIVDNINPTPEGSFHLCANKCLVVSDDLPDFVYQGTTPGECPDPCDTLVTSTLTDGCGNVSVNNCQAFDNINNFCGDSVLQWLKMIYILVRNINNDHRDLGLGTGKTSIPNL